MYRGYANDVFIREIHLFSPSIVIPAFSDGVIPSRLSGFARLIMSALLINFYLIILLDVSVTNMIKNAAPIVLFDSRNIFIKFILTIYIQNYLKSNKFIYISTLFFQPGISNSFLCSTVNWDTLQSIVSSSENVMRITVNLSNHVSINQFPLYKMMFLQVNRSFL